VCLHKMSSTPKFVKSRVLQPSASNTRPNTRLAQRQTMTSRQTTSALSSRSTNNGRLQRQIGKTSSKLKVIHEDEPPTEELYKISYPCAAKNCCHCVYTRCLGPVKVFITQYQQESSKRQPQEKGKVETNTSRSCDRKIPFRTNPTRSNKKLS